MAFSWRFEVSSAIRRFESSERETSVQITDVKCEVGYLGVGEAVFKYNALLQVVLPQAYLVSHHLGP